MKGDPSTPYQEVERAVGMTRILKVKQATLTAAKLKGPKAQEYRK